MYWTNGTAVSGNIDVGIYIPDENNPVTVTRLVSGGGKAQAGTSAKQSYDITDTVLGRGTYYFAMSLDNTTGTLAGPNWASAFVAAGVGAAVVETAYPLPATATLATFAGTLMPALCAQIREITAP
jgi:hypothetical protein